MLLILTACTVEQIEQGLQDWFEGEGVVDPDASQAARDSDVASEIWVNDYNKAETARKEKDIPQIDEVIADFPKDPRFRATKVVILTALGHNDGVPTDQYSNALARYGATLADKYDGVDTDEEVNAQVWLELPYAFQDALRQYDPANPGVEGIRVATAYCRLLDNHCSYRGSCYPHDAGYGWGSNEGKPEGRQVCIDFGVDG